jgi:hypothetical protein
MQTAKSSRNGGRGYQESHPSLSSISTEQLLKQVASALEMTPNDFRIVNCIQTLRSNGYETAASLQRLSESDYVRMKINIKIAKEIISQINTLSSSQSSFSITIFSEQTAQSGFQCVRWFARQIFSLCNLFCNCITSQIQSNSRPTHSPTISV